MKLFLDSSTIIYGFEFPQSNSGAILDLAVSGRLRPLTSEKAVEEVFRYFSLRKSEKYAYFARKLVQSRFSVVPASSVAREISRWRGKIKEKDLEHLATAKKFKALIVAFDRDFAPFPEYRTPRQAVEKLGKKPAKTEY